MKRENEMVSLCHQSQPCTSFKNVFHHSGIVAIALISIWLGISAKAATIPDPLIPRQVVFADQDKLSVRLSPDGQTISYLAPVDDKLGVWICSVADPGKPGNS